MNLANPASSSSTTIRHDGIVLPIDSQLARERDLEDKISEEQWDEREVRNYSRDVRPAFRVRTITSAS